MFSRVMRDSVRPNDLVSRYGGEEFVIVLPDCNTEVAVAVLERVRERLALALASGPLPPFTVSFGITSSTQHKSFEEILAAADRALIAAKSAGRNRVILADQTLVGAPIPNVPNA
jgi:diguanylate cyclase (GGDEF)-like protein